jgi:hypothetical protein
MASFHINFKSLLKHLIGTGNDKKSDLEVYKRSNPVYSQLTLPSQSTQMTGANIVPSTNSSLQVAMLYP